MPTPIITSELKERLYRREPVFSFEFFPPKTEKGEASLMRAVERLETVNPDFVSVTYGAGGGTREKTRDIVTRIQNRHKLPVMAHVTGYGHSYDEIRTVLKTYYEKGIRSFLALRGDAPHPGADWDLVPEGPQHAIDVVRLCRELGDDVSVGVAGFPEKHPDAPDLETDLRYQQEKVEAGADFVITQLFFDNNHYSHYVHHARKLGIRVPILPGVMPVTQRGQIRKFHELSGCEIPVDLQRHINNCGDDEAKVQEIGLAYCAAQCIDLLRRGAPGIHFYTLNKSRACQTIFAALHAMGVWEI